MKQLFFLTLVFGLIPTANARVVFIVNHGRINIEERCQDGKADHQVWHMDVRGKIQKLNKSRDSVGSQSSRTVDEARSLRMFSRK